MASRHRKHCTFKKSQVCICPNLEAALSDQEAKHKEELREWKVANHTEAVSDYRDQIIKAFTNLIDNNYEIITEPCDCSRWY